MNSGTQGDAVPRADETVIFHCSAFTVGPMPLAVSFTTLVEMFDALMSRFEDETKPVLMSKSGGAYVGLSFGELRLAVEELARGFHRMGLKRGDTVGIIAENRPEWVMCDMALMRLGVVTVPMYTTLTPKQIGFILADAEVAAVIVSNQFQYRKVRKALEDIPAVRNVIVMNPKGVDDEGNVRILQDVRADGAAHPELSEAVRSAAVAVQPEDLLTIIYTSGTTGNPKGVMLTQRNLVANIYSSIPCFPISHSDTLLSYLPLSHSFERIVYYLSLACGATIGYAESIETIRENLMEVRPTLVTTVPRLFERLHNRIMKQVEASSPVHRKIFRWALSTGYDYTELRRQGKSSAFVSAQYALADRLVFEKIRARTGGRLRFFVSGGAALSADLGRFFEAVGITIIEAYGMTESSPAISINRVDDYRFGTVGKPVVDVEVRIAPDGEILVRGENVMKGYWKCPEDTREIIDEQRWLHTGDIGSIDRDGFLTITDRKKHIFVNSGGKNIAPQHIEGLFSQNPYMDQFVLIGEKRSYCTALIVPDFDAVRDLFRSKGLGKLSNGDIAVRSEVRDFFESEIDAAQIDLANYERVRKFALLAAPLSIDNGELTPTMKVKRRFVEEKYRELIEKMYEHG